MTTTRSKPAAARAEKARIAQQAAAFTAPIHAARRMLRGLLLGRSWPHL